MILMILHRTNRAFGCYVNEAGADGCAYLSPSQVKWHNECLNCSVFLYHIFMRFSGVMLWLAALSNRLNVHYGIVLQYLPVNWPNFPGKCQEILYFAFFLLYFEFSGYLEQFIFLDPLSRVFVCFWLVFFYSRGIAVVNILFLLYISSFVCFYVCCLKFCVISSFCLSWS